MSDKYNPVDALECEICGELYTSPTLAEKCYNKCYTYKLMKEIAELRLRGGVHNADIEHTKSEIASMIGDLEEARGELEDMYGDDCDHREAMKTVQKNGGTYCHECSEEVNNFPEDPEVYSL